MSSLDQYYTDPSIASFCLNIVSRHHIITNYQCIEPSAGTGSFFNLLPNGSLGFDLDPRAAGIIKSDFFDVVISGDEYDPILTIGNPPFGKNSSLAVRFFNHAAQFSQVIAFIVPRTFRKPSIQNRLDQAFSLIDEETLPKNSFVFEGQPYDVPCIFQIWERLAEERQLITTMTQHPDFEFTTSQNADFAIQRVGVNAGTIKTDLSVSKQSHYFVKSLVTGVEDIMRGIDFARVKHDTAGNPSISKHEVIVLYSEKK